MKRTVHLVWLAAAGIAACSAFGSEKADPTPTTVDDAGTDVSTTDGAPLPLDDGGAIADAAKDAPETTSPCAKTHWLCDDFDRNDGPLWSLVKTTNGSLATGPNADAKTPPNALLTAAGPNEGARLEHYDTLGGNHGVHCELDLRVVTPASVDASLVVIELSSTALYFRIDLRTNEGFYPYGQLADGGSFVTATTPAPLPTGKWTHIGLDMAFGMNPQLVGSVNGTSTDLSGPNLGTLPTPDNVRVTFGPALFGGTSAPIQVLYDDIVCDLTP